MLSEAGDRAAIIFVSPAASNQRESGRTCVMAFDAARNHAVYEACPSPLAPDKGLGREGILRNPVEGDQIPERSRPRFSLTEMQAGYFGPGLRRNGTGENP